MTKSALAVWRIARIAPLLAVPWASTFGCQSRSAPKSDAPPEARPTQATGSPSPSAGAQLAEAQPGANPASADPTGATTLAAPNAGNAAATVEERPSVDENMGRGFQGSLKLLLRTASGQHGLRYLAKGNRARLQIDAPEIEAPSGSGGAGSVKKERPGAAAVNFDALIWDQNISVLDHRAQTYQTFALDDVKGAKEPDIDVDIEKTGERVSLQGVFCERYVIKEARQQISACVSALPGAFDVDKLEAVSGIDVPAWVEKLVEEKMLPLRATARGPQSQENYSLELVEYSAGTALESMLTLPSTYHARSPSRASP